MLRQQYPNAEFLTAKTAQDALNQLSNSQPDLVVVDLSIPEKPGMTAQIDTGLQLLQKLMRNLPSAQHQEMQKRMNNLKQIVNSQN